ncbi:MAG: DUF6702 family protein [Litorimonas sp.]
MSSIPSRRTVLAGLSASAVLASAPSARAHRAARTETELRIDADGKIGVIHVYHLQDAQTALYEMGRIGRPDLTPLRARAMLALYTQERFSLSDADGPVALEPLVAEIEGDSVYVYQEGMAGPGPYTVEASMLREIYRDQRNSVNIVRDGDTVTLDFTGRDRAKRIP